MANNFTPKYDVEDFLRMMDAAKQEQDLKAQVGMLLDFEDSKPAVIARLMDAAKASNQPMTEEEAGRAIDRFQEGLYSFKAPTGGTWLAEKYIDRSKIFWRRVVPASLGVAMVGTGIYVSSLVKDIAEIRAEKSVEAGIESAYHATQVVTAGLASLDPAVLRPSLRPELESLIRSSRSEIQKTGVFFQDFCSGGNATDDVTPENYREAGIRLKKILPAIETARLNSDEAKGLFFLEKNLADAEHSLESLMDTIRDSGTPNYFMERAENLAIAGMIGIDTHRLDDAQAMLRQLQHLKGEIDEYAVLPGKADRSYRSILQVAKEKKALDLADQLNSEARNYMQNYDIEGLRDADRRLSEMEKALNTEYTVRIVSKEGVLSGFHRTYDSTGGKKWYVVVEGVGKDGGVIPRQVRNQETGETKTVRMYAEEVPESIFDRVKSDKLDDGIIDNDIFSKKPRGYLSEKIELKGLSVRRGQITEW